MEDFFKQCVMNGIVISFDKTNNSFRYCKHVGTWEECVELAKRELNCSKLKFSVSVLYDKGFGTECITIGEIECASVNEAQILAEEKAHHYLTKQFGKKCVCEEVKITPTK